MLLLPGLLVLAGILVGLVLLLRPALMSAPHLEADSVSPRISAEVRAGEEQVMIAVARSLSVSYGRDQVGYGEIYVVSSAEGVVKLATRSEIGRGFDGEIRLGRGSRGTVAEYYVLRLPDDDVVRARVLRLDRQIADALRTIDPQAEVRMYADRPERDHGGRTPPLLGA
ncbi:MAG: hypothetical protein ACTHJL_07365 [Amnibacterium sp.]